MGEAKDLKFGTYLKVPSHHDVLASALPAFNRFRKKVQNVRICFTKDQPVHSVVSSLSDFCWFFNDYFVSYTVL